MRNFIRCLKHAWPYRTRLILSLGSALCVAALWSLNLSAIYPVLTVLSSNQSLHEWADAEILRLNKSGEKRDAEMAVLRQKIGDLQALPGAPDRENQLRRTNDELAAQERESSEDHKWLYRYGLLKSHVIRYLPEDRFGEFLWIIAAVLVGTAVKGFFDFCQESLVGGVVSRVLFDLRNRFYRAAIHQDPRNLGAAGTTELMARVTNDIEQIGTGLKVLFGRMVVEPLRAIGCLFAACLISWQLTVTFLVLVVPSVVALGRVSRLMKKAARRVLERMSDLYKILRETFDGIRVVKAFTREPAERRRFRAANRAYYRRSVRVINIDAVAGPVIEVLGVAAVSLPLLIGAYLVTERATTIRLFGFAVQMCREPMDFRTLLTLYGLLAATADPVRRLSSVYSKVQSGAAAADRVFALLDRPAAVSANGMGPLVPRHRETVEFRNVCFSYVPGQETLSNISLKVRAGETIALVGPNGCGKSTLLGLLARFYDPDYGAVLVDGVNLRAANLRSLRKQIGLVTQDTVLFDTTIGANIAYGKPGATPAEVEAAARKAFAHEFVADRDAGYDAAVGDLGSKLSGGQKQRVALARAILRDPRILILDEFTSQIDAESEQKIHQALKEFVKGRTTFLITHRLSTLELADRIVVMDAGRVVAVGTHAELSATCPTYQRLHEAQIAGTLSEARRAA